MESYKSIPLIKVNNESLIKKILDGLDSLHISYIFWGGLAYALYTGKDEYLNDVDILISIEDMKKVINLLYELKVEFKYVPGWESIVVNHDNQVVDFDPKEKYLKSQEYREFNLFGRRVRVVTTDELVRMYKVAIDERSSKSEKYKRKVEELLKLIKN